MTRKSLSREIQIVNLRLNFHRAQFQLTNQQSKVALYQLNPYLIIGVGLLAGVMTSGMGWRKIYRLAGTGLSFIPFIVSGFTPDENV